MQSTQKPFVRELGDNGETSTGNQTGTVVSVLDESESTTSNNMLQVGSEELEIFRDENRRVTDLQSTVERLE